MFDRALFDRAVHHYLDDLAFIARRAQRRPAGLADPDQPIPGWGWMLAGDPGHDAASLVYPDGTQELVGFVTLWYRQDDRPYHGQVAWDVSWHPVLGWASSWRTRHLYHRAWRPYPGDFLVRWATTRLGDRHAMPHLFIPDVPYTERRPFVDY
jgi:hypothetical protein